MRFRPEPAHHITLRFLGDVDALTALQKDIEACAIALGFPVPDFLFQPHITIGRINGVMSDEGFAALKTTVGRRELPPVAFTVAGIVLYRSVMTPEGPAYDAGHSMMLHDAHRSDR